MWYIAEWFSSGVISQISNFECEDEDHIVNTSLLLLFTFAQMQIKKLHYRIILVYHIPF